MTDGDINQTFLLPHHITTGELDQDFGISLDEFKLAPV